jgi:hypothetical protein
VFVADCVGEDVLIIELYLFIRHVRSFQIT